MALHTALTFFIVAIGILCARPKNGVMAVIASNSSGGTLVRRLLPAVILMPAMLGWMRMAGQQARLFDTRLGLWLLIVAIMAVLAALVGWNGKLLYRSDVDRTLAEQTLTWHATHDALTGLPNRLLLSEQLEKARGTQAALLFIDLDRFKIINDSLGHVIGDELLVAAGKRIAATLGEHQLAARLGGDEFTVFLPSVGSVDEAIEVARRIESAFESPIVLGAHHVFTSVSIGIAHGTAGESPLDLIRHADIAMYHAKSRGRARSVVFDPAMDVAAQRRLDLESGLRRAIERGELRVFYQPEVEIESGRIVGMEALVRWEHPQRGLVPPSEFISVAEESGLILPIGRLVLFEACRQSKEWEEKYRLPLAVSVNLSGRHFQQSTLIDEVADVLAATGIEPSHLILEITETVAMEGAEMTIEVLQKLKALGVRLAIDDFGTGFSSLAYLKRFPVDFLKIDKSFVDGVAHDSHDTAIVQAVIALGHALGLKLIAEGIESVEQVEQLRVLGSEIGQGYYFGYPLSGGPTGEMATLLAGTPHWMRKRRTIGR
jgi:diguanylate cyclase (GGDEF)-like protein